MRLTDNVCVVTGGVNSIGRRVAEPVAPAGEQA